MSVGYRAIQWSRHKRVYDSVAAGSAALYIVGFGAVSKLVWRGEHAISDEIVMIRALGSCAIVMLHVVLCIGPLARLNRRFLPVLYNRRHLGVMTFGIALAHAALVLGYYHGFGTLHPLVSLLVTSTGFGSARSFPFELLGVGALVILFLMAATSHDFWLKNLSTRVWKSLHMLVYLAYLLLVGHVAFGALQNDRGALGSTAMAVGLLVVVALHLVAGGRETRRDKGIYPRNDGAEQWIDAGAAADIPEDRARTVCSPGGERIAIFRHKGRLSAVTNLCAHQGGPLGEGKVIDGCITCPWHGWQYRPHDGCSPPPFAEKIATYQVRVVKGNVQVNPRALAPGTPVEPAACAEHSGD